MGTNRSIRLHAFADAAASSRAASTAASAAIICSHTRELDSLDSLLADPPEHIRLPLNSSPGALEHLVQGSSAPPQTLPCRENKRTAKIPKVLIVGWDAADWKVIQPLMDAGKMPNIRRLVETGCTASIATLQPPYSPMLWTSIATGKRPFEHGIHGFTEPRADGRGVHRVTNLARKCKALWNILGQNDFRSIVVGWWPSFPAEPINGVMVSDTFSRVSTEEFGITSGLVHPPELTESLAALRLSQAELPAEVLEFFVPHARDVDQDSDSRLGTAARIIAECASVHAAATWLMDREPWDLCAIYFDSIDHFGHGFMRFNPPQGPRATDEMFSLYQHVMQAGYLMQDQMLGSLLARAGDETTVILLSDHGFHPDHLRPTSIPQHHAGPATEHRDNGIFVIAGPGIRKGLKLSGVGLLDITPTVLNLFGLAVGEDMDGRTLREAFEIEPEPTSIPSWDKVDGNAGCHPPHMKLDPRAASESLDQLVALGYVDEPDADSSKAVKRTVTDLQTNLAEAYQDAGFHEEAAAILRDLRSGDRDEQRLALRLFISVQALRRVDEMEAIAADWAGRRRHLYDSALARIGELRDLTELNDEKRAELKNLRRVCRYDPSLTLYFQAEVFRAGRRWSDALACLEKIPAADLIRPGLFTDRVELLGRLKRWGEAEQLLAEALAINPTDARIHISACRVSLHRGDFAAAADSALSGLSLLELDPYGHYLLGVALARAEAFERAAKSFTRALEINPNYPQAHLWLARLYRRHLARPDLALQHSRSYLTMPENASPPVPASRPKSPTPRPVAFAATARNLPVVTDEVVIVSGLPRSGTSMLMQMLVAGGLTPLTDGLRQADEDNPRGYFEFEPVRKMANGTSWIDEARGKVVKIVAPMIPNLPDSVPCRVILIERDLDEILASQRQMIVRKGREFDDTPARRNRLKQEYLRLIIRSKAFLAGRAVTNLLCVDRNAVLQDPRRAAEAMNRFLGGNLDVERMTAEVRPELHRQRNI